MLNIFMKKFSKITAFGASITAGRGLKDKTNTWSSIIARNLQLEYLCLADISLSNATITRKILNHNHEPDQLVLVLWTSTTRYEFKTEDDWLIITPSSNQQGFTKQWYSGPGQWEYTGVSNTLKEILLAQTFLRDKNISYLFTIDNNEVHGSWLKNSGDTYIKQLYNLIDWDRFVFFDNQGFLPWCKEKQFEMAEDGHPLEHAHSAAANYILSNLDNKI